MYLRSIVKFFDFLDNQVDVHLIKNDLIVIFDHFFIHTFNKKVKITVLHPLYQHLQFLSNRQKIRRLGFFRRLHNVPKIHNPFFGLIACFIFFHDFNALPVGIGKMVFQRHVLMKHPDFWRFLASQRHPGVRLPAG